MANPLNMDIFPVSHGKNLGFPKSGCFKSGGLQFLCRSALLRFFAPFCAPWPWRSFALAFALLCADLRSFAFVCVFLRPTAFRTTPFGNSRKIVCRKGNSGVANYSSSRRRTNVQQLTRKMVWSFLFILCSPLLFPFRL